MAGYDVLDAAAKHARSFLEALPQRRVGPEVSLQEVRAALDGAMPDGPMDSVAVIDALAQSAAPGLMGTPSSRFFGFVIGGALPAALAADWLTSTWDQNAGLYAAGPAAAIVEEVAGRWLIELFGLPSHASFAFVTGTQMAHFTALAAARHHVLAKTGWDVNADGLFGAPRVRVIVGEHRHVTLDRALRYLGIGASSLQVVPGDDQGRIDAQGVARALAAGPDGPTIVCVQAGDVNTGSFDQIGAICDVAHEHGAWAHVDGAFGLWAAASPALSGLIDGVERADSWTTDGHKWLNVPYDNGFAVCAHPEAHNAAVGVHAAYLIHGEGNQRDQMDWTPEFSRRARGFTVYAALRSLGRAGVTEMIERCCRCARRFSELLGAEPGVEILNDVVLNQVLVAFTNAAGEDIAPAVVEQVQRDGTCWLSGSVWRGRPVMRISVSNWATTLEDVERSAEAILRAARTLVR